MVVLLLDEARKQIWSVFINNIWNSPFCGAQRDWVFLKLMTTWPNWTKEFLPQAYIKSKWMHLYITTRCWLMLTVCNTCVNSSICRYIMHYNWPHCGDLNKLYSNFKSLVYILYRLNWTERKLFVCFVCLIWRPKYI